MVGHIRFYENNKPVIDRSSIDNMCQGFDCLACRVVSVVTVVAFLNLLIEIASPLGSVSNAASVDPVIECSSTSADEPAIYECVSLMLVEAETALEKVEQHWQRMLQTQESVTSSEPVANVESSSAKDANVIAIVDDTALRSGISSRAGKVINVDESEVLEKAESLFDSGTSVTERFSFLPALFRSYRDQHCSWQATVFATDRAEIHYMACVLTLTRGRTSELNQLLAEHRANAVGLSYRGYYVKTDSGAFFQACDRKTDWWVSADSSVLGVLDRRYADISAQSIVPTDLLYAEFRGNLQAAPASGNGADFSATINIEALSLLRPVTENDCSPVQLVAASAQNNITASLQSPVEDFATTTVDDFASSGFLYGYFNNWLSACSVVENSVCSAETEAQFASDGEWKLRIDRSLENDWRLQLIPTTNDSVIEKDLEMQIDRAEVFIANNFKEPLLVPMRLGFDIANGELARGVIVRLRQGGEVRFQWHDESDVMSELKFSLYGVTRALDFFDNTRP